MGGGNKIFCLCLGYYYRIHLIPMRNVHEIFFHFYSCPFLFLVKMKILSLSNNYILQKQKLESVSLNCNGGTARSDCGNRLKKNSFKCFSR